MRWLILFAALRLWAQADEAAVERHAAAAAEAMRSGDYISAERHNRVIVKLRPKMAEAEVNLGLSCFLQKKYDEAIRAFEAGLKLNPEMTNARLFLGISRFYLDQLRPAATALQEYTAKRPEDFQGHYYQALTYLALEQYPKAQEALAAARRIQPRNVDVLYHLAQTYLGEAKQNPAKQEALRRSYQQTFVELEAIDPNSFRLAQLRASYHELEGKKAEAMRELEGIFQHDPKARGLHYTLGCLYTEARQYTAAREQFEAELQLDAPYLRTYLQLGHVYLALEKPEQAIPLLERALRVDPASSGLIWVDIGRAYRSMNRPEQSIEAYERAIQLGQATSAVYYQLAMAARSAGRTERAREALAQSQRLRSEENRTSPAGVR
ncbi:MAG TPA: tetratricopeptide repeat protein [Bryobacteraceae bacterium]|nr:tetratricopeptide repeat protein [Bryobacteraceae bacterium]